MTRLLSLICLAVVALACGLLGTGAGVLEYRLPGGVPFGNALTVAGLVAAASFSRLVAAPGSLLRILSYIALAAAVAWYPVSIAMAGNLNLVFPRGNGRAWTYFTLAGAVVVGAALFAGLARAARLLRAGRLSR